MFWVLESFPGLENHAGFRVSMLCINSMVQGNSVGAKMFCSVKCSSRKQGGQEGGHGRMTGPVHITTACGQWAEIRSGNYLKSVFPTLPSCSALPEATCLVPYICYFPCWNMTPTQNRIRDLGKGRVNLIIGQTNIPLPRSLGFGCHFWDLLSINGLCLACVPSHLMR